MSRLRPSGRTPQQMRALSIDLHINAHAEGSCMVRYGDTHVLCTATVDEQVPPFLRGKNSGWVTAEYGMLPRATGSRMRREAAQGKQSGRTQEIQRLIGRSLRAVTNLAALGERQIIIDCDVIQADGGTRTASITGGFVAMHLAMQHLSRKRMISHIPLMQTMAAISCGIVGDEVVVDLDYEEDSNAEVDANFVMTDTGQLIEVQATGEKQAFSPAQFNTMLEYAANTVREITALQRKLLKLPDPYLG
jgi:ribonuclease PH